VLCKGMSSDGMVGDVVVGDDMCGSGMCSGGILGGIMLDDGMLGDSMLSGGMLEDGILDKSIPSACPFGVGIRDEGVQKCTLGDEMSWFILFDSRGADALCLVVFDGRGGNAVWREFLGVTEVLGGVNFRREAALLRFFSKFPVFVLRLISRTRWGSHLLNKG